MPDTPRKFFQNVCSCCLRHISQKNEHKHGILTLWSRLVAFDSSDPVGGGSAIRIDWNG